MPKLFRLSGSDVVRILEKFDFMISSRRGSHIKLKRITQTGEKQTLTINSTPGHVKLFSDKLPDLYHLMNFDDTFINENFKNLFNIIR